MSLPVKLKSFIGPCAWILVAEIWPLSIRGKGVSIAASSNWVSPLMARFHWRMLTSHGPLQMNNFIVGQVSESAMLS